LSFTGVGLLVWYGLAVGFVGSDEGLFVDGRAVGLFVVGKVVGQAVGNLGKN